MKNYNIILFAIILLSVSCSRGKKELTQGLKYPYDMCQYDDGILISNLGGDSLNYLSSAPTGFVSYYRKGKTKIIIPPNSGLYAPKGIDVSGRFLFVADVKQSIGIRPQRLQKDRRDTVPARRCLCKRCFGSR